VVVGPAADLLLLRVADLVHRRLVGAKAVGGDRLGRAVALQRLLDERQRRGLVPLLGDKGFQHLALMVDGAPEVVHLAVDLHVDLVQMSFPMGVLAHCLDAPLADLRGKHRTEPVPSKPHRLMADVDPPLVQQVLHVPKRERELHVHHHHQPDDLR
jgi:hypothetical protein